MKGTVRLVVCLIVALALLVAAQGVLDVEPGWRAVGGLVLAGLGGAVIFNATE